MSPYRLVSFELLILVCISACVGAVERYEPVGPPLSLQPWVFERAKGGQHELDGERVDLSLKTGCEVPCFVVLKRGFGADSVGLLRVRARLQTAQVVHADRRLQGGHLFLAEVTDGGLAWSIAYHAAVYEGDFGPMEVEQVFPVGPGRRVYEVFLTLAGAAGQLSLEGLEVCSVRLRTRWMLLRVGVFLLWIWRFTVLIWGARRPSSSRRWVVLFGSLMLGGTLAPRSVTQPFHQGVERVVQRSSELLTLGVSERQTPHPMAVESSAGDGSSAGMSVGKLADKLGHFSGFLLFAFAGVWLFDRHVVLQSALFLAAGTESLQWLTASRSGQLSDVALDLLGALIGLALAVVVRRSIQDKID